MRGRLTRVELEAACANIRNLTLAKVPGDFGRLVYLASLRDYNAGEYHHAGMALQFGEELARDALALCHEEIFSRLVNCSIEDLVKQLEVYAADVRIPFADLAGTWERLQPYRVVIPLGADPLASRLFMSNVRAALAVLQERQTRAPEHPQSSSPHQ
jgi:hypothetical protein